MQLPGATTATIPMLRVWISVQRRARDVADFFALFLKLLSQCFSHFHFDRVGRFVIEAEQHQTFAAGVTDRECARQPRQLTDLRLGRRQCLKYGNQIRSNRRWQADRIFLAVRVAEGKLNPASIFRNRCIRERRRSKSFHRRPQGYGRQSPAPAFIVN